VVGANNVAQGSPLAAYARPGNNERARCFVTSKTKGTDVRDWLLIAMPAILVIYFALFPDQFHALVAWALGR
jgi:hypothetical protein